MNRLVYIVPVAVFAGIVAFFLADLHRARQTPPDVLPSALIGKPAPQFDLPPLDSSAAAFSRADLASGRVTVMNVFASWCAPCREEAPALGQLAEIGSAKGFNVYGLVQKDTPANARAFLSEMGNPFARIDLDADGSASINFGVYGVPETFVIDGHGVIRDRIVGAITPDVLDNRLLPDIAKAGPS